jgi:hypothetical protein
VGHVARNGRGEVHTGLWWGNLKEKDNLEGLGDDGKKILKWIFKKSDGEARTGCIGINFRFMDPCSIK